MGNVVPPRKNDNPSSAFKSPPELRDALAALGSEIACGEGTVLFREGDAAKGVYIVLEGRTSLTMTNENGQTALSRISGPGGILGLPGTFLRGIYHLTATTMEESRFIFVEREGVLEYFRSHTDMCMLALSILGAEVSQMPVKPPSPKRRAARKASVARTA